MKGFIIKINDENVIAVSSDRSVCVFIGAVHTPEDNYICVQGTDSKLYRLMWLNRKLEMGDRIKIQVAEVEEISPVEVRKPSDRNELKKRYYELKKELENNGLI